MYACECIPYKMKFGWGIYFGILVDFPTSTNIESAIWPLGVVMSWLCHHPHASGIMIIWQYVMCLPYLAFWVNVKRGREAIDEAVGVMRVTLGLTHQVFVNTVVGDQSVANSFTTWPRDEWVRNMVHISIIQQQCPTTKIIAANMLFHQFP